MEMEMENLKKKDLIGRNMNVIDVSESFVVREVVNGRLAKKNMVRVTVEVYDALGQNVESKGSFLVAERSNLNNEKYIGALVRLGMEEFTASDGKLWSTYVWDEPI